MSFKFSCRYFILLLPKIWRTAKATKKHYFFNIQHFFNLSQRCHLKWFQLSFLPDLNSQVGAPKHSSSPYLIKTTYVRDYIRKIKYAFKHALFDKKLDESHTSMKSVRKTSLVSVLKYKKKQTVFLEKRLRRRFCQHLQQGAVNQQVCKTLTQSLPYTKSVTN